MGHMQVRITVEGNIGSGKSTLISSLQGFLGLQTVLEPVEIYTDFHGYNLLLEQQDPLKRFACQVAIANTLFKRGFECTSKKQLVERGNESVKIFIKFFTNEYSDLEHRVLLDQMETLDACRRQADKDIVVYLRTSVETALKRIRRRGRSGEESIDPEFLQKLSDLQDEQLLGKPGVTVIDANEGGYAVREAVVKVIRDAMKSIN